MGKFRGVLLQAKFLVVAFINGVYSFIPFFFLRKIFLSIFGIKLGKKSYIHRGARFFHVGGVTIGNNSVVNFNCFLDGRRGIFIGNNVGIAHNTKIYTLGHDMEDPEFKTAGSSVHIKDNAFVFANCLIMPGVTINEGAIVLPGSIVTKDVEAYKVVGGIPAKPLRDRNKDINYKLDYGYWFAL